MDIAIINFNDCEHLHACLSTIDPATASMVVVVDNASTDGSVAMLQREFPWVVIQTNPANVGYGVACNQAVAACHAEYVLLLNSDTLLLPGTLQALGAYMDEHPKAAIVGPRLLNTNGSLQPSCYSFPTPLHVFLEESTLIRLVRLIPGLRNLFQRTWSHTQSRMVDWVLGAAISIRRGPFNSINGFDKSYFLYVEEIDLCYRLRAAGWETHFTPNASVIHVGGASTQKQQRGEMALLLFRNMSRFYRQYYSDFLLTQYLWIMKIILMARRVRDSVRLYWTRDSYQRAKLTEDLGAWRKILAGDNKE